MGDSNRDLWIERLALALRGVKDCLFRDALQVLWQLTEVSGRRFGSWTTRLLCRAPQDEPACALGVADDLGDHSASAVRALWLRCPGAYLRSDDTLSGWR